MIPGMVNVISAQGKDLFSCMASHIFTINMGLARAREVVLSLKHATHRQKQLRFPDSAPERLRLRRQDGVVPSPRDGSPGLFFSSWRGLGASARPLSIPCIALPMRYMSLCRALWSRHDGHVAYLWKSSLKKTKAHIPRGKAEPLLPRVAAAKEMMLVGRLDSLREVDMSSSCRLRAF